MMKVNTIFIVSLMFLFLISGCIVRTYSVVRERPDQEIKGNQGYLMGSPSQKKQIERKTRNIYVTEIELGKSLEEDAIVEQYKEEKAVKKPAKQKKLPKGPVGDKAMQGKESGMERKNVISTTEEKKEALVILGKQDAQPVVSTTQAKVNNYVVKSGDTLEKIAARPEVYGDKNKWYKIYKANEDRLKEPNKIYPGQVLKIPE